MTPLEDTANATISAAASKGTIAGAGIGMLGWLTSDAVVGLIGVVVAISGLVVNVVFKWLDTRDKRAQIKAEEARAQELHELQVIEIKRRLEASNG